MKFSFGGYHDVTSAIGDIFAWDVHMHANFGDPSHADTWIRARWSIAHGSGTLQAYGQSTGNINVPYDTMTWLNNSNNQHFFEEFGIHIDTQANSEFQISGELELFFLGEVLNLRRLGLSTVAIYNLCPA
jgi:hypothetical protein